MEKNSGKIEKYLNQAHSPVQSRLRCWKDKKMARIRAVDTAVLVLEKEGVDCAVGVPGAAINPFYSALKARGRVRHILARHVEAAPHMAEGYTRAKAGNIGLCIGTSGP